MTNGNSILRGYFLSIQKDVASGNATEPTEYYTIKQCLEALNQSIVTTIEPKRIACGAPDFVVAKDTTHGPLTIGYVEAKDVNLSLSDIERDSGRANPATRDGQQLKRYLSALPNLLFTNYLEFRWYVDGKRRQIAELATLTDGKVYLVDSGIDAVVTLLNEFLDRSVERVSRPQELAQRMARLTHIIRDIIVEAFDTDEASTNLRDLYEAFEKALIPDLSIPDFADMFAQTLAYGLFAARVNHTKQEPFRRQDAANEIPRTNPFLRRIFTTIAGPELNDEPFAGFVDDLAQLLQQTDMEAVLADFGKRTIRQDPIMHFYETFLTAYDPKVRELRGVYYTPEPVVSFIVRSVDCLLRARFNCPEGLADTSRIAYTYEDDQGQQREAESHRILILDPACGTGTFLYSVVDQIREQFRASGNAGLWPGFVKDHLLKRLFGFELLMAPYAMAHLKLGMQLAAQDMREEQRYEWAYDFGSDERLGVYLTNTLEQAEHQVDTMFGPYRIITEEANAAAEIKRDLPVMVVLGNPPYSGHSANASWRQVENVQTGKTRRERTWIGELIQDYYFVDGEPLGEKNPKWLQDDYVKFIRFGQWRIQQTGGGILAFITNHSYLDNPTFRGMRQQLTNAFTDIYVLNLHGNSKKKEVAPDGGKDENVFDIQQGVAIGVFIKEPGKQGPAKVHYADLWGLREGKYEHLFETDVSTTEWTELKPQPPHYLYVPQDTELRAEYEVYHKVNDLMPVNSVGVVTSRDRFVIEFDEATLRTRINSFLNPSLTHQEARSRYLASIDKLNVGAARKQLRDLRNNIPIIRSLYRPFDERSLLYHDAVIERRRNDVMRHMLAGENLALMSTRQTRDKWDVLATSLIVGHKSLSAYDITSLFPLYLYPSEQELASGLYQTNERHSNLSPHFVADLEQRLGLTFIPDGVGDLERTFGPEDVFYYIYAILHSPAYRSRYAEFLKRDFPRVPITSDLDLFGTLVGVGSELVSLHLMESTKLNSLTTHFPIPGDNLVERGNPRYLASGEPKPGAGKPLEQGRIYISKDDQKTGKRGQYFEGVPPDVWESQVGGYQPLDKWLKDRRGRTLSYDDIMHYQRIVVALQETIRLMERIDEAIPSWPLP